MRIRKPESRGTDRPFVSPGFTLVELLVVISVILLLAMLLMPTIQVIIRQFYAGKSAMMVRRLHDGALLYKEKTRFLPGEKQDTKVPGGSGNVRQAMNNGSITGSQVLAACLFNIEYNEINLDFSNPDNADNIDASKVYATFKPEYLINFANRPNSLSDGFPQDKAMPICYFLASDNPNYVGKVSQFRFTDNADYMDTLTGNVTDKQQTLEDWVAKRSQTTHQVFNNGGFILIAAGLNREYLVSDVEDPSDPEKTIRGPDTDDITNDYGSRRQP